MVSTVGVIFLRHIKNLAIERLRRATFAGVVDHHFRGSAQLSGKCCNLKFLKH